MMAEIKPWFKAMLLERVSLNIVGPFFLIQGARGNVQKCIQK